MNHTRLFDRNHSTSSRMAETLLSRCLCRSAMLLRPRGILAPYFSTTACCPPGNINKPRIVLKPPCWCGVAQKSSIEPSPPAHLLQAGPHCVAGIHTVTQVGNSKYLVDAGTITTNTVLPAHKCKRDDILDDIDTKTTLYMGKRIPRSPLDHDILIPFRSEKGRKMLMEFMGTSSSDIYLSLSEQFLTQSSPPSCGVATLAMVLNSLHIDPGRVWRKPWRWFTEDMLISCFPLEKSEQTIGLTMEHFGLIAECNGAVAQTFYGSDISLEDFRKSIKSVFSGSLNRRLVVAFDRSLLGQTGTGHYSPIGAYHETSDAILILDVARFKYPPYWVSLDTMWRAMRTVDPESGRSRGYFIMSSSPFRGSTAAKSGDYNSSPIEDLDSFLDSSNTELKRLASNLVHDVRKRMLSCTSQHHHCRTIIDCSAYHRGGEILEFVKRDPRFEELSNLTECLASEFSCEADMRPVDFFIQSMPQLVNELTALCILENTQRFSLSYNVGDFGSPNRH